MERSPRFACSALLAAFAACGSDPPALLVGLSSELSIPTETNSLIARISRGDNTLVEESYVLGAAPRDVWPQSLPVVSDGGPRAVDLAVELRLSLGGEPAVLVGFGTTSVEFPKEGVGEVSVDVPRDCVDADGDGFGIGLGCRGADCDEADTTTPDPNPCTVVSCTTTANCDSEEVCDQQVCKPVCYGPGQCGSSHFECIPVGGGIGVCECRRPCERQDQCYICNSSQECVQLNCRDNCCQP